jgi:hypothetical protein
VAGHGPISLFLLLLYSIRQDALQKQKGDDFATKVTEKTEIEKGENEKGFNP